MPAKFKRQARGPIQQVCPSRRARMPMWATTPPISIRSPFAGWTQIRTILGSELAGPMPVEALSTPTTMETTWWVVQGVTNKQRIYPLSFPLSRWLLTRTTWKGTFLLIAVAQKQWRLRMGVQEPSKINHRSKSVDLSLDSSGMRAQVGMAPATEAKLSTSEPYIVSVPVLRQPGMPTLFHQLVARSRCYRRVQIFR